MGLLATLVTLPLAPVRAAVWVVDQVAQEADRQMFDETHIRAELVQLELDYDDGLVSDEERAAIEDEIFARLSVARERTREEGVGTIALSDDRGQEAGDG